MWLLHKLPRCHAIRNRKSTKIKGTTELSYQVQCISYSNHSGATLTYSLLMILFKLAKADAGANRDDPQRNQEMVSTV